MSVFASVMRHHIHPIEDSTALYALHIYSRYADRKVKTVEDNEVEYESYTLE